jgi:ferrous-iron efflux pump FieF
MTFALVVTTLLVLRLQRVAAETQSLALAADARHYSSDILVNLGVIAGLGLYELSKVAVLDPLISLAIVAPILRSAWIVFRNATDDLMDRELPDDERTQVIQLINGMSAPVLGYHGLRTRKSGARRYVEVHLHVAKDVSFEEAHRLTHVLEHAIAEKMPGAHVTVHAEPVTRQGERVHTG